MLLISIYYNKYILHSSLLVTYRPISHIPYLQSMVCYKVVHYHLPYFGVKSNILQASGAFHGPRHFTVYCWLALQC